ncbi:PKD domain-containing protein [Dysgonomonas sp. 511]|uniref:PKD domain-containing protein n=1 Tax=Dysgonomonas sp. 511 TaxID=2302930 RepID=UPI0013D202B4|nr:PKD domain-containing protein [Dysgonomonas sp. 511]NDV78146.1 PKD domain-containing protein [Dysgonomonas sp. 511]
MLVNSEFQATIQNDNYTAPVSVSIKNSTTGADFYKWSFEGGSPDSSNEQYPGTVIYNKAGTYTITLEAWNNNERDVKEFTFSVDSTVHVEFNTEILINDFAPAEIKITNLTTGASAFEWIFDGGEPASSNEQFPENVIFDSPGEHKVTLTVNNGREIFSTTQIINLLPKIEVDFEIEPSFDDFDYEVPFTASLINKTQNGLTYLWRSTGGTIVDKNAENTEITFTYPGTYTITLEGNNEKETKSLGKEITLKANTNLYTLNNVKFGIKKAEETIGCFYSLSERKILPQSEINSTNGQNINLVFFGLDASFSRCYFLSPADALSSGFASIPNPTQTYFINDLNQSALTFTDTEFDEMVNDAKLKTLGIKAASNTTSWFTNVFIPRFVLFETENGIKGVIRIKAFVSQGSDSYILADIKVQKEPA